MKRIDFRNLKVGEQKESENQKTENMDCVANGCPRLGTLKIDGIWICRYHYHKPAKDWGHITLKLRNHEQEVNWHETMHRASETDFFVGNMDGKNFIFPETMKPFLGEDFYEYRKRITTYLNELLYPPKLPRLPITGLRSTEYIFCDILN
jgi:hypothetical protein